MLPISDILIRSISGYVFIIPVLILYFFIRKKSGRKQSIFHIIAVFVFCYYLFGILTVTGIGYTSTISFRPRISLIPFLGMISGPIDTILNVVLFVPFGFFSPIVFNKLQKKKIYGILIGIIFSIVIESVQTFTGRFVQLDDMLMNTLGTFIGYELWFLLSTVKLKQTNIYVK